MTDHPHDNEKPVTETLYQYVVYDHPSDFPDKFVVRLWTVTPKGELLPTDIHSTHDTLDEARETIPCEYLRLPRCLNDDPNILEIWL